MTKLIILIVLTACSNQLVKNKTNVRTDIAGRAQTVVQQPVSSSEEALKILKLKKDFFHRIFTQSFDPYFGTPRWSEQCLKENLIEDIKTTAKGVFFRSALYLTSAGEPGACSDSTNFSDQFFKNNIIYYSCEGDSVLTKITVEYREGDDLLDWTTLCI